ncbi:MAG TPA: hypothetical protein VMH02_01235 [Verrucomicrobiae bacterium]|nr:hypothetical protein [Verrucomicrobiae bacterium]
MDDLYAPRELRRGERRVAERRRVLPDALMHHLGWMLTQERRKGERRQGERRGRTS